MQKNSIKILVFLKFFYFLKNMNSSEQDDFTLLQDLIDDHNADPNYFSATYAVSPKSPPVTQQTNPMPSYIPSTNVAELTRVQVFADVDTLVKRFRQSVLDYFGTDAYVNLTDEQLRETLFAMNCISFEVSYFIQMYSQIKKVVLD
jgi:hypothetical protein